MKARLQYVVLGVVLIGQACSARSVPVIEQGDNHWTVLDVGCKKESA